MNSKSEPRENFDALNDLVSLLDIIVHDHELYKKLLQCREQDAQMLLDTLQRLLDDADLSAELRGSFIVATQRLSKASKLYPACYELKNITLSNPYPVFAGGFADIFRGDFEGRDVSLKAIRIYQSTDIELFLKQFSKEAVLWRQLYHPHILPLYGLSRHEARICLVSPWMENGDIDGYLKAHPEAPRLPLVFQIAEGLLYLHNNGVVHGDLKPPNILIDRTGMARLADFGLSSVSDPDILTWLSNSSAASKGGTTRWQAPELFDVESDGVVKNSKASDVYAWSLVSYQIFTGTVPFAHTKNESVIAYHITSGVRPTKPLPSTFAWQTGGLTESIWQLLEKCWHKDALGRPDMEHVITQVKLSVIPGDNAIESSDSLSIANFWKRRASHLMTISDLNRIIPRRPPSPSPEVHNELPLRDIHVPDVHVPPLTKQRRSTSQDDDLYWQSITRPRKRGPLKILLLGQKQSGKTTLLKHLQLLHSSETFNEELDLWRNVILLNIVRSVFSIHEAMEKSYTSQLLEPITPMPRHYQLMSRLSQPLLQLEADLMKDLVAVGAPGYNSVTLAPDYDFRPSSNPDTVTEKSEGFAQYSENKWKSALTKRIKRLSSNDTHTDESIRPTASAILNALKDDIKSLWMDPTIRQLLVARRVHLEERGGFFLDHLDRVTSVDYKPTNEDILRARMRTQGVFDTHLSLYNSDITVIDMNGSRRTRSVWPMLVENLNALLFCVPVSSFDQWLKEDAKINTLGDSISLWDSVVSNELLQHVDITVLFTKVDILKEKLAAGVLFKQFVYSYGDRPNDYKTVTDYLRGHFARILKKSLPSANSRRPFRCHFVSLMDMNGTRELLLAEVRNKIFHKNATVNKVL